MVHLFSLVTCSRVEMASLRKYVKKDDGSLNFSNVTGAKYVCSTLRDQMVHQSHTFLTSGVLMKTYIDWKMSIQNQCCKLVILFKGWKVSVSKFQKHSPQSMGIPGTVTRDSQWICLSWKVHLPCLKSFSSIPQTFSSPFRVRKKSFYNLTASFVLKMDRSSSNIVRIDNQRNIKIWVWWLELCAWNC